MRRFLHGDLDGRSEIWLAGDEGRHLARVLRARPGDRVALFDGLGLEFECVVERVERTRVLVRPETRVERPVPVRRVDLRVALPRGKRMDVLIEKAVECGVDTIAPTVFARSARDAAGARVVQRWNRIAAEAAKQCARSVVPRVLAPLPFDAGTTSAGALLVADPEAPFGLPPAVVGASEVQVVVGPEGGLSAEERAALDDVGAIGMGLGGFLLRIETAAAVAVHTVAWTPAP